ncbi:FAD/NAD(P)-binding domain-containing protein [Rhizodiscina lignyota]|uniref:FAD/NAD(P)-binding domain-containing protein n=1 Tax=Rhizodiscina lignyota TaxID=1504668 RepID=A0A9P4IET1_9PEZI|nr:FAD/NAD(P)-binding domain-containing protein [Rhizodiscina lignyota]
MAEKKNIIILGASYAGLSSAHYFLKHILPSLPAGGKDYHVYLVDPSTHWFTRPAAPRAVIKEDLMPYDKTFLPIADGFKSYSADKFSFMVGTATTLDIPGRTVTVSLKEGGEQTVPFHSIVIATGVKSRSPILGVTTDAEHLKTAIDRFRTVLPSAKSIVIAGGGPAGVETAGEIGEFLNGTAGFFSRFPSNPKTKITLVAGPTKKLLPALRPAIAKTAEKYLNRVGVEVMYGTKVTKVSPETSGYTTTVYLDNGAKLEADIFIPANGVVPNTEFIDKFYLNDEGYLRVDKQTLRLDIAGKRIYAVGDVAALGVGGVMAIYDEIPVVMTNMKRDLLNESKGENALPAPKGEDMTFTPNTKETQVVPVGRGKGVGAIFGWRLPSFFVWMIKGRDYFTSMAPPVQNGSKWAKEAKWKDIAQ